MSEQDFLDGEAVVRREAIGYDGAAEWVKLTNACRVDLEILRSLQGLKDKPNTELVIPIKEGVDGVRLISKSSQHVAIMLLGTDTGWVTAIEGRIAAEGGMDIYRDDGEENLAQVEANDEGLRAAAGLLQGLIQATQYNGTGK